MCPNCGLGNVRVQSLLKRDEAGAEFVCPDCGWKGGPAEFQVPCTKCGCSIPWAQIELDGECNIVCRVCYLKDPPAEDIAGVFHDVQAEKVDIAAEVGRDLGMGRDEVLSTFRMMVLDGAGGRVN